MSQSQNHMHRRSVRTAFCGMAAALSVALMLLGGVVPVATYGVPMICSLPLLFVLLEFDARAAWITYLSVALLSLMLGFDKEAAFFYLFVGYYPIVKGKLDRIRPAWARLLAKIGLFTASIAAMYALMALLFTPAVLADFQEMGAAMTALFAAVYVICMLLFDRLLLPAAVLYVRRIRPHLTFLRR